MTTMTCAQAINVALAAAMEKDPNVMVMGLGVNDPKRVFGTTFGLVEKFGEKRVIETPCSEAAMTGVAIGAALMGKRPVLVHQRVEFALLTMEQIINNAAKIDYLTCGKHKCPIVIRLIIGRGWGQGPTHSQSLESLFAHIPGLTVLVPHDADSHYQLMRAAIRLDGPVIFFEHRWLHDIEGEVYHKKKDYLFVPKVVRPGCDITLVSWGYGVQEARVAAYALAAGGISAEIIAAQCLRPMANYKITESCLKTGRLLIIEMDHRAYGIGAEIAASYAGRRFKIHRIGLPDHPIPSTQSLVGDTYPSADCICWFAMEMVGKADQSEVVYRALETTQPGGEKDVPRPSFTGPF